MLLYIDSSHYQLAQAPDINVKRTKVCSKTLEPYSRNQHNLPNFKPICDFSFVCFQGWVGVYDKVFNGMKNQIIRAKNVKIVLRLQEDDSFGRKDLHDSTR